MRDNPFPHTRINAGQVIDFSLLLVEILQGGRSGAAKCIMVKENIVIKEVNLCYCRLRGEVKHIATSSSSADDGNLRYLQFAIGRDNAGLSGCCIEVVKY